MADQITIRGRVGTPPQHRTLPSGTAVTTFRVGSTRRRQDPRTGEWSDAGTSWYTVSAYRRLAEHAAASIAVGQPVVVVGRLRVSEWDNGTAKGTAVDIDADALGHDLAWGTSAFVARPRADESAQPAPGPSDAESAAEDQWAVPGGEGESAHEWATASVPAANPTGAARAEDAPF